MHLFPELEINNMMVPPLPSHGSKNWDIVSTIRREFIAMAMNNLMLFKSGINSSRIYLHAFGGSIWKVLSHKCSIYNLAMLISTKTKMTRLAPLKARTPPVISRKFRQN
jgi:hypothetical protein